MGHQVLHLLGPAALRGPLDTRMSCGHKTTYVLFTHCVCRQARRRVAYVYRYLGDAVLPRCVCVWRLVSWPAGCVYGRRLYVCLCGWRDVDV